jgi:uroporphyrin-III C-methyltransferase
VSCLRRADLVLYDALVDERVVRIARRAQRFFVGKRAGRHALAQHEIHALMIRAARRGRRVVRLKGGDPFVFGRGGEEAIALQSAGIPFEVVPGVSSVMAAPAAVGIPLTHRDTSAAFLVVSGHDADIFDRTVSALKPDGLTLVVVMGYSRRTQLASSLVGAGWSPSLPVAIVADGTSSNQQVWRGSLGALLQGAKGFEPSGPALIVVGAVAAFDLRTLHDGAVESLDVASSRGGRRSR